MRTKITVSVVALGLLAIWTLAFGPPATKPRTGHRRPEHEVMRAQRPAAVPTIEAALPAVTARLAPMHTSRRVAEPEQAPGSTAAEEHGVRRQLYARELPDSTWTERMRRDLAQRAESILGGNLKVDGLSCHHSVCRMYFELERKDDIDVFIPSAFEPDQRYSYRVLDADDENDAQSTFIYEVLVTRPWPGDLPPRTPEPIAITATNEPSDGR